jgi:GNAT superfamily N-acetyltransferase
METDPQSPDFVSAIEAVEARAWASLPVVKSTEQLKDDHGAVVATALFADKPYSMANRVVGLGLERPVQLELLDRIVEMYDGCQAGSIFIPTAPTARPSTLPRLLRERGFEPTMKEAKLYRKTENPPPMDQHDYVVVAKEEDYETVLSLYRGGGMDASWSEVMAEKLGTPGWYHYLALDGNRPVALAAMYASEGFALNYHGWTPPPFRHRGYQRALAAYRIAQARDLGCQWTSVNLDVTENPIGFTIKSYTRAGFELLYVRTTHIRHEPSVPLPDAFSRRLMASDGAAEPAHEVEPVATE